jgi:hypothetical protein
LSTVTTITWSKVCRGTLQTVLVVVVENQHRRGHVLVGHLHQGRPQRRPGVLDLQYVPPGPGVGRVQLDRHVALRGAGYAGLAAAAFSCVPVAAGNLRDHFEDLLFVGEPLF